MFQLPFEEERRLNDQIAHVMLWSSLPTFVVLRYVIPSPWGKTLSSKRRRQVFLGPRLPPRISWFVFESPNLIWIFLCWMDRRDNLDAVNHVLLLLFVIHYIQRDIVYPMLLSNHTRPIPLAVVAAAFCFCTVNGYLQAQSLCQFQVFPKDWRHNPQFVVGILLFVTGFVINIQSDAILRQLRTKRTAYQIPTGALFEYVSAPHYLGEVIEWTGFCLACNRSKASAAFLVFTAANLIPRALAHHAWYQSNFGASYPVHRKAIVPFLW